MKEEKMNKHTYTQLEMPLLETLNEMGGRSDTQTIYKALADKLNLSESEREARCGTSTHKRFDRMVRWVRQNLVIDGFISGEIKGIWSLTEKAKSFLKNAKPGVLIKAYEVYDNEGNVQGVALWGEAAVASNIIENGSINLIITSPPFPLAWEMPYGNKTEDKYTDWFLPMAEQFYDCLAEDGSFVLELRNTYIKGQPVQSLYIHELVLALCKEIGFYLAQEHYSHNQGALTTTNWVTVKRSRVTNSVNNLLWLTKTPYPNADNRRVLVPYSAAYKKQLSKGGYPAYKRSSGHVLDKFTKDNGGKIPSNLIIANSVSNSKYIRYCKENGLPVHPARFSPAVPEYFIKLTTEPGDIVYDPFSGSNEVGRACKLLNRRFIVSEKSLIYLQGSVGQFDSINVKMNEQLL